MAEPLRRVVAPQPRARRSPAAVIPFIRPELPALESLWDDFQGIYRSRVFSNAGPVEQDLSERFCRYLGVTHAIPVANATLGLMIAIKAMARPGRRKVVLPSFTFAATALAVEWCGLEPVFCDIEPRGWQAMLPLEALAPIADDTALLLVCNTFGAPADVAHWAGLARSLEVPLLVDSAPGLGATYVSGRRQGGAGFVEVFSMHATKPFAIGEGGLITTDDAELAVRMRRLRSFGFDEERICQASGFNAKLTEMQAAIALRVLERIDEIAAHRRARAAEYVAALAPLGMQFQAHGACSAYQFMPVKVPAGVDVPALRQALASEGIETRTYFSSGLHQQPHFRGRSNVGGLQQTEALCPRMLSLPMSNTLTSENVTEVCEAVVRGLEASR